jgi:hypothetical protein
MRIAGNASIVDHVLSGLGVDTVNILRELTKLHDEFVVRTSCPKIFVTRGGRGCSPHG